MIIGDNNIRVVVIQLKDRSSKIKELSNFENLVKESTFVPLINV